jgi:hypothetical protein
VNAHAGPSDNISDAFAAKLNSSGELQWNTFMGGTDWDYGHAIAIDGSMKVYVGGKSEGTWGSPVNAYGGTVDAFAAKLSSSGAREWHTFMGSADIINPLVATDSIFGIAADGTGNVYVTGEFWGTWGSPENAYTGSGDAAAAKLDSSGNLLWHTFIGSSTTDSASSIALDAGGNIHIAGYSNSTWGSPVNAHSGGRDGLVAKLSAGAAVNPEIHVKLMSKNIADDSTFNFGTLPLTKVVSKETPFTIQNLGTTELSLTGSPEVYLTGPDANYFYISMLPSSTVAPGGSTVFKIKCKYTSVPPKIPPGWQKTISLTVNIPNDDPDENPYNFILTGTVKN